VALGLQISTHLVTVDAALMKARLLMKAFRLLLLAIALSIGFHGGPAVAQFTTATPEQLARLPKAEKLPDAAAKRLRAVGAKVFGIKWGERVLALSDRGFQVVTDSTTTLSYRPRGNAYFVQTGGESVFKKSAFKGSDEQLIARGRAILAGLGIDKSEIREAKVLQQFATVGEVDSATRQMKAEAPQKDRRTLLLARAVHGVPVFDSRLALDLDADGKVAAFELSWPKIDPKVLQEAIRLQRTVKSGYEAPPRAGAKLEQAEAGILHSTAAAFMDEQVAAIRLIYAPTNSRLGMKPLLYLAANGKPVAIPRNLEAKRDAQVPPRPVTTPK